MFFNQRKAEIGKKSGKCKATPWDLAFAIWKLFIFFIHVIIQKFLLWINKTDIWR